MLKDQRDLLLAFNEYHVRYILVGGYALGLYTEPRVTKDMDVWVGISSENAELVYKALAQFGAPLAGYTPHDFQDPYSDFQIGLPPSQIDILFAASGVDFEEAWQESQHGMTEDGIPIRYLSADHFIRNKTAAGRLQDLADAAAVIASLKANKGL